MKRWNVINLENINLLYLIFTLIIYYILNFATSLENVIIDNSFYYDDIINGEATEYMNNWDQEDKKLYLLFFLY